jgi:hypothetical protein
MFSGNCLTIVFGDETMFSNADVRFSSWDSRLPLQFSMIRWKFMLKSLPDHGKNRRFDSYRGRAGEVFSLPGVDAHSEHRQSKRHVIWIV